MNELTALLDTARAYALAHKDQQLQLLRTLGQIPAPSHQEGQRAAFIRDWLLERGAPHVCIDQAQNVVCALGGWREGPLTVFAAHTDIVFPDTQPLPMGEEEGRLFAPGIGDDTANLVNLLLCAQYLLEQKTPLKNGLLIVANACEEGLGNLDGTKQLFADFGARITAFYSFDGYFPQCTNGAVGSHRYKVTCRTTGGHSYGDWGRPNAIHILSTLITELYKITPPDTAKTTYNVGVIQGGSTVNSIAQEACMLYEFRSTSQECLGEMEKRFLAAVDACEGMGGTLTVELLGLRPGDGALDREALALFTRRSAEVVEAATGQKAVLSPQSTDSNIPLSRGILANTLGTVTGGLAHTRQEWIDKESLSVGLTLALGLLLRTVLG